MDTLKTGRFIAQLRKERGLTQQELGELVGVTNKTVSRWENGTTYPDIELLPAMSRLFDIRVGELLGVSDERKDAELNEYYDRLAHTTQDSARLEILREMRDKYPRDAGVLSVYQRILHHAHAPVEEIRNATQKLCSLGENKFSKGARLEAKARLYDAEDEDKAEAVLEDFPENPYFDRRYLEMSRHYYRGEWEKISQSQEAYLLHALGELLKSDILSSRCCAHDGSKADADRTAALEEMRLSVINTLTGTLGKSTVSGDGEPDLWFYYRINSGLRLSCALAGLDKFDESLLLLEDTANLFERFWTMPNGTELSFRTKALPTIRLTPVFFAAYPLENSSSEYDGKKFSTCCLDGFSGTYSNTSKAALDIFFSCDTMINFFYAYDFLSFDREKGWEWFDCLRTDKRYKSCVLKMKKYVPWEG